MRKFLLVFLASVAVMGFTACDPNPPTSSGWLNDPNAPGTKTAIVGDSLVAYDPNWPTSQLATSGPLAIWSKSGASYNDEDPWLETLTPVPDVLVIAMGANNANNLYGGDGWTSQDVTNLQHMIWDARRAPGVIGCIVLVTVAPAPDAPSSYVAQAAKANAHVRQLAASSSIYRLVDWSAWVKVHPNRASLFTDFIHHTPAGAAFYREALTTGAMSCPINQS